MVSGSQIGLEDFGKKRNRKKIHPPQRALAGQSKEKPQKNKVAPLHIAASFLSIPNRIGTPRIRDEEHYPTRGKGHHHRAT